MENNKTLEKIESAIEDLKEQKKEIEQLDIPYKHLRIKWIELLISSLEEIKKK